MNINEKNVKDVIKFLEQNYYLLYKNTNNENNSKRLAALYHVLNVAKIIIDLDFSEFVVIGALLHDITQHTDVTTKQIKEKFGDEVESLIVAVRKLSYSTSTLGRDEQIDAISLSFIGNDKLIVSALAIKIADRIDNLLNTDRFSDEENENKLFDAKTRLANIAKKYNMVVLKNLLRNACFKNEELETYNALNSKIKELNTSSYSEINNALLDLRSVFTSTENDSKYKKIISCILFLEFEDTIPFDFCKEHDFVNITSEEEKFEIRKIYIIFNDDIKKTEMFSWFYKVFNYYFDYDEYFIDQFVNKKNRVNSYFVLCDRYGIRYRVYLRTKVEHLITKVGIAELPIYDVSEKYYRYKHESKLSKDEIRVYKQDGTLLVLPKGSSALDFAFKLHRDYGIGFQYAVINRQYRYHHKPYTLLEDGNEVIIFAEGTDSEAPERIKYENNKNIESNIKKKVKCDINIRWLNYCITDRAKDNLLQFFINEIKNGIKNTQGKIGLLEDNNINNLDTDITNTKYDIEKLYESAYNELRNMIYKILLSENDKQSTFRS